MRVMAIEHRFDITFVAQLALREKQIQQRYRPYIQVHKWFARRPGTLFRALLLSEFVDELPLEEAFFRSYQLEGIRIADPFMGGGTPLLEANRLGCDVVGYDINPMAWWIVGREIERLDLQAYQEAAKGLIQTLEREIGHLYRTECVKCGMPDAYVKSFLWVKVQKCVECGHAIDLFPGYLISENKRHPVHVLVCGSCGDLGEVQDLKYPGSCATCGASLSVEGPAKRGSVNCSKCNVTNRFPAVDSHPLGHRMFAIEYHCPACKPNHKGRFFKRPSAADLGRYEEARKRWAETDPRFVPDDRIPPGDESTRLHKWGYYYYSQLFNERQLLGLELSCRLIARQENERIKNALATNLSDLLRYNNMLVRYDTMALKALDIFSVHGFPVGLVRCEVNLLGIQEPSGKNIGSGGWTNVIEKYIAAKEYCERPFEVKNGRKEIVYTRGEWIGDRRDGMSGGRARVVDLRCGSATEAELEPNSLDAVLTDPPYFDSIQYAELMDFCYAWLRRLVPNSPCFQTSSTRDPKELTGNDTEQRDLLHFTEGLSKVFRRMAVALKPGHPLAFTYHHNRLEAYYPIAVALLDAGLTCTATLPCPAEMGGSIHIKGTGSSIVDSVFVCRSEGEIDIDSFTSTPKAIAKIVSRDVGQLLAGGVKVSRGDIRCLIYGHLTRLVIWQLRDVWDPSVPVAKRLRSVQDAVASLASPEEIANLVQPIQPAARGQQDLFLEDDEDVGRRRTVSFSGIVRGAPV